MKKIILGLVITLIWSFGLMSSEVKAQTCPNPSGCIYITTSITLSYSASRVTGYSYAQADYTAGLNFDPRISGSIYRTDFPETDLDYRDSTGIDSSVPAIINLFTTDFVNGKTYCNYTNYFAIRRSNGEVFHIASDEDCKTITLPPTPTPTATPTPTPTVTPTPCNPDLEAACQGENMSLIVSPSIIKPSGVTGGTNRAKVKVRVTNYAGNPVANRNVTLRLVLQPTQRDFGGHIESLHTGNRPLGKLDKITGITNSNGYFETYYSPPHISGGATITASSRLTYSESVAVLIGNLSFSRLGEGENYKLIGQTNSHPDNHWGTSGAVAALPQIANDYKDRFYGKNQIPEQDKVAYNDMSLTWGGKFDLKNRWENTNNQHGEHREGINCDVRSSNISRNRWVQLNEIFRNRGSNRTNDETGTSAPHWHLRFEGSLAREEASVMTNGIEQNPEAFVETNSVSVTPHSLVEQVWWAILDRESTQSEWANWYSQIVEAKNQGNAELIQKVRAFQQELFSLSEYRARNRTDNEFIEDVFNSHFLREPTVDEKTYWLNYLQNLPISLPQQRKRVRVLDEIEQTSEFESVILGIVDEETPL